MIVVSLTTTSERLRFCAQTLLSLFNQSVTPDRIQLWISENPYLRDNGISPDRPEIQEFYDVFPELEIKWTLNTGPYRKLLPALNECSEDDVVIMVDDDIIYGRDWLRAMLEEHDRFPECSVATRVRKVTYNKLRRATTYTQWQLIREDMTLNEDFIITGAGGVLFRKKFFSNDDLSNLDFLSVCPTADDLWFSRILQKNGVPVRSLASALRDVFFIEHNEGLIRLNSRELNSKVKKFMFWMIHKRLGNLGFSICKNDVLYKNTKAYFANR